MNIFKRFWNDQDGVIVAAEIVLVSSLLIVGAVTGLTSVRDAVVTELVDVSQALANLNQSYSYSGVRGCGAYTAGSVFNDVTDRACVATGVSFIGTSPEVPRHCPDGCRNGCPCPLPVK